MEPAKDPLRTRMILALGKYRVVERREAQMKLALGGSTTMTIPLPPYADVREGDLLTLYTEVLFNPPPTQTGNNANT
jgi:hypothetical protein